MEFSCLGKTSILSVKQDRSREKSFVHDNGFVNMFVVRPKCLITIFNRFTGVHHARVSKEEIWRAENPDLPSCAGSYPLRVHQDLGKFNLGVEHVY